MSELNITILAGQKKRLLTAGKYCEDNIVVTAASNSLPDTGDEGWIGDGNTHIWISLQEGRTSPMLGVCPNGTVTVDWGDGATPDVLTGTSTSTVKWTPIHEYAEAGDYIITLTVDGEASLLGDSNTSYILRYNTGSDGRSRTYANALRKIEIGNGVTIAHRAFCNCHSLSAITISKGVTSIGTNAFNNCYSLLTITIPEGVTSIGNSAFNGCYSLSAVALPNSLTSIGNSAFYNCRSLSAITIPEGVTSIADSAFYNCYSLSAITIPEGITSIGNSAFYSCHSLSAITIPEGVTSIGNNAFNGCNSLSAITIPEGLTSITGGAFYNCLSLSAITIPEGVTSIEASAFYNCRSLSVVALPSSLTSIADRAFYNCHSLSTIAIPENVTSIGASALNSCYSLRYCDFTKHMSVAALGATDAFGSTPLDLEIRVPAALYDEWIAATNWAAYASYIKAV